jgi:ribosomal protein L40E
LKISVVKLKPFVLILIFATFLLTAIGSAGRVQAAPEVVFHGVQVGLWPEREGPSVVVSLDIKLASYVSLPQAITLKVPTDADVASIQMIDDRGSVERADWEETSGESWKDLHLTVTSPNILVTYTDPLLIYFDQVRTFNYLWYSNYSVDNLTVSIRQPYGAGELVTHPESAKDGGECCIYNVDAGPVTAGMSYGVNFHYVKDLENAEYPALGVEPMSAVDEMTQGRAIMPSTVVIWLLGFALLLIFLVALYYWWYQRHYEGEPGESAYRRAATRRKANKAAFCHECGGRSQPGDTYCRNCGTELRQHDKKPR